MNINHLGDALDHWKGCMIRLLGEHLHDLHVIPMFTDEDVEREWTAARLRLYCELLQLGKGCEEKILHRTLRLSATSRRDYFTAIANADNLCDTDLFIDPGTGIAPRSRGDARHIRTAEIANLLPLNTTRVLLIYQHSSREDNWTDTCLERLVKHDELSGCKAFAYWAGSASLFFVSRGPGAKRLASLRKVLCEFFADLPPHLHRITDVVVANEVARSRFNS